MKKDKLNINQTFCGQQYRLYPSEEQAELINKTIGCARKVYNELILDYQNQSKTEKRTLKEVTYFKKLFPYLDDVDSLALANAKQNVQMALNNFFKSIKGQRKGKKMGFPKTKKKNYSKWSYTTNCVNNSIRVTEDGMVKLPKLGYIKIDNHRQLQGTITSATITLERDGTYTISFKLIKTQVNPEPKYLEKKPEEYKVLGIDMSFSSGVVYSDNYEDDGAITTFVRQNRKNQKKQRRLSKAVSRKQRTDKVNSKNREKARQDLAKFQAYESNYRKDYWHKVSRKLTQEYDFISLEDINLQGMSKKFGKSIGDLSFGLFRNFLNYKSLQEGCIIYYVDRFFASTQLCSACGYKNEELKGLQGLKIREWICPKCGAKHNRDVNAGNNLRNECIKYYHTTPLELGNVKPMETIPLPYQLNDLASIVHEVGNAYREVSEAPSFTEG